MTVRLAIWGARLIKSTTYVDRAYVLFDRLRSRIVLAWAPESVLDAYNDLAYGQSERYRPDRQAFHKGLYAWEEEAIASYFPPAPARILVGGAGGGREALALADRGYSVVAFEPSLVLLDSLVANIGHDQQIEAYVGRYEELPTLHSTAPDAGKRQLKLTDLGTFDAALAGWSSFSHLRTDAAREATLRTLATSTTGPLLVSFFATQRDLTTASQPSFLRRLVSKVLRHNSSDSFRPWIGYFHQFNEAEITSLARRAGLELLYMDLEDKGDEYVDWPHVILGHGGQRTST